MWLSAFGPCGRSPRSGPETSGIRCDTSTNIPIFAPVTEGHFTRENHGKGGIFRYRRYVGEFQDAQDAREHPKGAGGAPRAGDEAIHLHGSARTAHRQRGQIPVRWHRVAQRTVRADRR